MVAMQNLGKKLEAETKGRLTLKMFPNMVLGDEKSMIEQTQAGGIDSRAGCRIRLIFT